MIRKLFCILSLIAVHGFLGAAENLIDFKVLTDSAEKTFIFYRDGYDANNFAVDKVTGIYGPMSVHYVIEVMDLQRYAAGSVFREMPGAPLEAQKAQAVASRTFVLGQLGSEPTGVAFLLR